MKKKSFELTDFRERKLPTQSEIMASWGSKTSRPLVSVICIAFNHADYIRDAIKGFLIQKTKFPFEVIVHDDASTDGTKNIVQSYVERYPEIIKPIFQSENQYSKGKRPTLLSFPFAQGKFIALCEGDDFWISSQKLQRQAVELEKYNDISGIFNPCYYLNEKTGKQLGLRHVLAESSFVLSAKEIISTGGGVLPTPTFLFKRQILDELPAWFENTIAGDYYIQSFAAIPNGLIYDPFPVACYRKFSATSVTNNFKRQQLEAAKEKLWRELSVMKMFEGAVDQKFRESVISREAAFAKESANVMLEMGDFNEFRLFINASWNLKRKSSYIQSVMYYLRGMPCFLRFLYKIKKSSLGNFG